ncbi:MAG: hypothetical protein IJP47_02070 [Prevotella sp.]|nr:hypothetical protein [Prevotella sp.]
MAGFLYDMAKIIFSATVITSVMAFAEDNFESFHLFLLIGGFITTWLCAWWANRVLTY